MDRGRWPRDLERARVTRTGKRLRFMSASAEWGSMAGWMKEIDWHEIAPGRDTQNAVIVNFNRRLQDELLNVTLLSSLYHARDALTDWKDANNTVGPYSAIGDLPPGI